MRPRTACVQAAVLSSSSFRMAHRQSATIIGLQMNSPCTDRSLAERAQGRNNNLNVLRAGAASLVLLSHCWPLSQGSHADEPAMRWLGVEMGSMAVWVFFALSGFLVAASQQRRPSLVSFAGARARRILPGLIVMLLLLVFVYGPVFTRLPLTQYLQHRHTWSYLVFNATLYKLRWGLPGVFDDIALNGSLWTLPIEVRCYALLAILGWTGILRHAASYLVLAMLLAGLTFAGISETELGISFLAGTSAWRWRARIILNGAVALSAFAFGLALMHLRVPFSSAAMALALSYGALYLAYVPDGAIRAFNRLGDYSFGIYIYAFPVQVMLHQIWPALGVFGMFASAMPMTLLLAMLSWHAVESPALQRGCRQPHGADVGSVTGRPRPGGSPSRQVDPSC